jgi:hypothetical protein
MDASAAAEAADMDAATAEYRSVSGRAVLALALGLASPAALIAPVLMVVPAAAVGAALLAERGIRSSGGVLTGVALARCGLALALASVGAAAVRAPVRDALLLRQAMPAAERWFGLLAEGRDEEAFSLLSGQGAAMLYPAAEPGQPPTPAEEAKTIALEHLRNDPVARCLRGKKAPLVVRLQQPAGPPLWEGGRARIDADFTVSDGGEGEPCRIHVQCVRSFYGTAEQPWRIERWSLAPPITAQAE